MLASLSFLTPLTVAAALTIAAAMLAVFVTLRWLSGPPAKVARRWSLIGLRLAAVATLLLILLNPSDVTQTAGPIDRPDIFYLLDSSQSMAVGDEETRFQHAARLMREAEAVVAKEPHANVKLFRFGHRLAAIQDSAALGLHNSDQNLDKNSSTSTADARRGNVGFISEVHAAEPKLAMNPVGHKSKEKALAPTDSDTQLLTALRQVSSRFGRRPPASLVLFSDGRARDDAGVEQVAAQFGRLKVPVHVVPVGDTAKGGDVAIVACVVPPRSRKFSEVDVQVFLRSYGYDGRRCEVSLTSPGVGEGTVDRSLGPTVPITLHDGFQSVGLSFRTEAKPLKLKVAVSEMPDEVSTANNTFKADVQIDRTKIRILYIEGSSQPLQPVQKGDRYEVRGPYSDLQQSLVEDEDIECVVLHAPYGRNRLMRISDTGTTAARGFPETLAELSAFDAIILSDVGADSFTEQQLGWIDRWISQRGGGLMMVGGQRSFAAGQWDESPLAQILPIEMRTDNDWVPGTQVGVSADVQGIMHPLWKIAGDDHLNREIVGKFPSFFGANRWGSIKPNLTRVLATSTLTAAEAPAVTTVTPMAPQQPKKTSYFDALQKNLTGQGRRTTTADTPNPAPATPTKVVPTAPAVAGTQPAIVVGQYGRGRTMAMAVPITSPWANDFLKWGEGDTKYFAKFWRNAIYWLTESSSIGRRRLVVTADKKFYRPGETITLNAAAFDEAANQTGTYKITSMIEPQVSLNDLDSNYAPVRWPDGKARESGESGPFIAWGEEFDLPKVDSSGKPAFSIELPIADALTVGSASQSLRVELTAMEEYTQVDSTSLDIQILHDPFEQQNPFPNHELLASIAKHSGGQTITDSRQLAEVLRDVPMKAGAPIVKKTPLWSNWWLWSWMLGLLSVEWIWRRFVGLA